MSQVNPGVMPSQIGPYPITRLIGAGSMGNVYLGHDPMINRPVAIKTIQRESLDDEHTSAAARFRVEAQSAGRLNHPGIVSVYQYGEDAGCSFIAMEYVPGHSLREHIVRGPRFDRSEVLCVLYQLLDALQYAHERGVIHRDIKPANLIITPEGKLKVSDFGIARMESADAASELTRGNLIVGTPGFMAPEQYIGGSIDRRVDIFASGVILYQLLSGLSPFTGGSQQAMYQILYAPTPALPAQDDPPSHAAFDAVLARALAKRSDERYESALAFREALAALGPGDVPPLLVRAPLAPVEPRAAAATGATHASAHASAHMPPPGSGMRPSAAQPPSTRVPTGWNESALSGLERELAVHVGPIAKVLVRRSARERDSLEAVRSHVAEAIADPAARQRFLHVANPLQTAPASTGTGTGAGSMGDLDDHATIVFRATKARHAEPWQPADLERLAQALVPTLGPIAKVVLVRASRQVQSREALVTAVLDQVATADNRAALEAAMRRALA